MEGYVSWNSIVECGEWNMWIMKNSWRFIQNFWYTIANRIKYLQTFLKNFKNDVIDISEKYHRNGKMILHTIVGWTISITVRIRFGSTTLKAKTQCRSKHRIIKENNNMMYIIRHSFSTLHRCFDMFNSSCMKSFKFSSCISCLNDYN